MATGVRDKHLNSEFVNLSSTELLKTYSWIFGAPRILVLNQTLHVIDNYIFMGNAH